MTRTANRHAAGGRLGNLRCATMTIMRVIAHRGASARAPEHTLAAYAAALEDGANGLECDVRLTADGYVVCVHDRRVERTSNGVGAISALELADLESLNFAANNRADADSGPESADLDDGRVLTLDRLLEHVCDAGRPVEVHVETKHPTRYAGLVERRVIATLRRFGLVAGRPDGSRALLMSFSGAGLRRAHEREPGLPTVLLFDSLPTRMRLGWMPTSVSAVGPSIALIRARPDIVGHGHAHGRPVQVWTVNSAEDVTLCHELGVDAVITDYPREVRAVLRALA